MIEQSNDNKGKKTAVLFSVHTHGVSDEENDSSLIELRSLVKTMALLESAPSKTDGVAAGKKLSRSLWSVIPMPASRR